GRALEKSWGCGVQFSAIRSSSPYPSLCSEDGSWGSHLYSSTSKRSQPLAVSPFSADPYQNRAIYTPTGIRFTSVTRKDTGKYICGVLWTGGSGQLRKSEVDLIVQMPPSKPVAKVPTSVTVGNKAVLTCMETDGFPPPTFQWYRDNVLMPSNPKISEKFRNSSYTIDTKTGVLTIEPVTSFDTGDYFCEAQNNIGTAQKSEAIHLEASKEMGVCRACLWVHVSTLGSLEVTCKLIIASAVTVTAPSPASCSYSLNWLR
uniref:Junctional adhesion molecule A n=1 Tax=Chelydra serpentina TaxID=8475 RepID=A0A8C3SAB7_CHESE